VRVGLIALGATLVLVGCRHEPERTASLQAPRDLGMIVFVGEDNRDYAMRPSGEGLRPFAFRRWCVPLDFSLDGRVVACATSWPEIDDVYVMNRDGSDWRRVPLPRGSVVADASLSPDGRQLIFTNARRGFEIWRVSTDGRRPERLVVGGVNQHPRWSPDGTRITYIHEGQITACGIGDVVVMDVNSRRHRVVARDASLAKWSPDGKQIAFVDDCGTIRTASVGGGRTKVVARGAYVPDFAWSPNGTSIAFHRQQDRCSEGVKRVFPGPPSDCTRVFVVSTIAPNPRPVGTVATSSAALFWLPSSAAG